MESCQIIERLFWLWIHEGDEQCTHKQLTAFPITDRISVSVELRLPVFLRGKAYEDRVPS